MKSDRNINRYKMSSFDVEAILIALPLVNMCSSTPPGQHMINSALCKSSAEKLRNHQNNFTVNELRVISAASLCATEYLAGRLPEIKLDSKTAQALKAHFFSYAHLNAYFQPQLDALDNQGR